MILPTASRPYALRFAALWKLQRLLPEEGIEFATQLLTLGADHPGLWVLAGMVGEHPADVRALLDEVLADLGLDLPFRDAGLLMARELCQSIADGTLSPSDAGMEFLRLGMDMPHQDTLPGIGIFGGLLDEPQSDRRIRAEAESFLENHKDFEIPIVFRDSSRDEVPESPRASTSVGQTDEVERLLQRFVRVLRRLVDRR